MHRTLADAGKLDDGVFETAVLARVEPLAGWVLRQNGRAVPLEPDELRDAVADALAHAARAARRRAPGARRASGAPIELGQHGDRPVGPVAPERFGVLQALLAHLLAACGDDREPELDADELAARFSDPTRGAAGPPLAAQPRQLRRRLLHGLRRGRRGRPGVVRVDKELYGDVFRKPPKLTPLEARAIRLAIDYVGPTIAAEAHTPLDRVRKKLEETFGQFELAQTPQPRVATDEEQLVRSRSATAREAARRRDRVPEGGRRASRPSRDVEPYSFERELPVWRVHTWDRTADGAAHVPPRPHALRAS